ncbi:hypothetical protein GWI33_006335 [Rhynchophorus ferrugineus]|uniref:Uncharacterized protein n=1 Tax=Rhynchophorus ferrugineus TaxID=354439 RepID=A0A834IHU0_RHYFE|nr:hypothetical protein GWI33_006335 [Rhynchophorus ferrugineus]
MTTTFRFFDGTPDSPKNNRQSRRYPSSCPPLAAVVHLFGCHRVRSLLSSYGDGRPQPPLLINDTFSSYCSSNDAEEQCA